MEGALNRVLMSRKGLTPVVNQKEKIIVVTGGAGGEHHDIAVNLAQALVLYSPATWPG